MKTFLHALLFFIPFSAFTQNSPLPLYGKTTGILPYLNYGLGADRLGGAKMTYLDTGIVVKVIDSAGQDYKLQLSTQRTAWLPKIFFSPDTLAALPTMTLSGSARVYGDDQFDYIALQLNQKLPYRSLQQIDPSQIVIDVFGATSNTNWITQLPTARTIRHFYYEQVEDDVFRMIIGLKQEQHWGYSIYYQGNALVVRVKRPPQKLSAKNLVILLDAGHGGTNTGAKGVSGILEKDYTLLMTKAIEKYLRKKNLNVHMMRVNDETLDMPQRIQMAQALNPDLLLSVHLNSSANKTVKGTSTYYRHIGFRPVSQFILNRMLQLELNNFGNIGGFNFSLNGPTDFNNCLLEAAFLSNADDENRIMDPSFHKQTARQVYRGIKDWVKSMR